MNRRAMILGAGAALVLVGCEGRGSLKNVGLPRIRSDAPGTKLTADDVRQALIGNPWRGPSGVYHFRPDGTFTYTSEKTTLDLGPRRYTLRDDGIIETSDNTFEFFRIGSAYRYRTRNSDQFFLALPVKTN